MSNLDKTLENGTNKLPGNLFEIFRIRRMVSEFVSVLPPCLLHDLFFLLIPKRDAFMW